MSEPGITRALTDREAAVRRVAHFRRRLLVMCDIHGKRLNEGQRADVATQRHLRDLERACMAFNEAVNEAGNAE